MSVVFATESFVQKCNRLAELSFNSKHETINEFLYDEESGFLSHLKFNVEKAKTIEGLKRIFVEIIAEVITYHRRNCGHVNFDGEKIGCFSNSCEIGARKMIAPLTNDEAFVLFSILNKRNFIPPNIKFTPQNILNYCV
tara:strand:+ start:9662 stop:10078 length:417 start_codon:yes stop_codon:yes gene_type:complete